MTKVQNTAVTMYNHITDSKKRYIRVAIAYQLNMPTACATVAGILTYKPDDDSPDV